MVKRLTFVFLVAVSLKCSLLAAQAAGPKREDIEGPCNWKGLKIPSLPGETALVCRNGEVLLIQSVWVAGSCTVKPGEGLPNFTLTTDADGIHSVTAGGDNIIYPSAEPDGDSVYYPKGARPEPALGKGKVTTYYERDTGKWTVTITGGAPVRRILGECSAGGYRKGI